MLTVGPDVDQVDGVLRRGELACPGCSGVLAPWAWARPRTVRDDLGSDRGGCEIVPRRAQCRSCKRTHVLLPTMVLARRADAADVIGSALLARASGWGARRIAARVGRALSTVRGWLGRWATNATRLRAAFTGLLHELDDDPHPLAPAGSPVADAVAAVGAAVAAVRRRWGTAVVVVSAWQVASALTHGRLLAPTPPAVLTNTSTRLSAPP